MAIQIKRAVKYDVKLRLALYGPSGAGKTMTALKIAEAMQGDKRICVIDTERGSASKYADLFNFDVIELSMYHPHAYIEAIKAVDASVYSVLIIDSVSHEWEGSKGALEMAGQDFRNWAKVTPLHNAFVDAMLGTGLHVIATMRAKEDYATEAGEGGKLKVRPVGMGPIQRKGVQYEFDIVGSMDIDNVLSIEKTRCSLLIHASFVKPKGADFVSIVKPWLMGAALPEQVQELAPTPPQSSGNGKSPTAPPSVAPSPVGTQTSPIAKPSEVEKTRSDFGLAYGVKWEKLDSAWERFKQEKLKRLVSDPDMTVAEVSALREIVKRKQESLQPVEAGK